MTHADLVIEAGQILRGETLKLATVEHLKAVAQLVAQARIAVIARSLEQPGTYDDWLAQANRLAGKVTT